MANILIKKNLRWLGDVHKMENDRLLTPRHRLRFKDVAKRNKRENDQLQLLATDG